MFAYKYLMNQVITKSDRLVQRMQLIILLAMHVIIPLMSSLYRSVYAQNISNSH